MIRLLLVLTLFISLKVSGQTVVFAQLTGAPVNTVGWNLTGNAYVGNTPGGMGGNSEIILTNAGNSQSGAIFYSQPINIVQCDKWTVDFEFRIFEGSGADGIAFCLLDVPPSGFVGGGGVGIPAASNGLKIVFDTYDNCGGPNPSLQIRWGAGYSGECDYAKPTLENTAGQLTFFRSATYNTARIEYDAGNIEVYVNNTLYLTGFYNINFTTYAGFTASTGGANDRHSIRNVVIKTDVAQPHAYAGINAYTCSNHPIQIGEVPQPTYQYHWTPTTGLNNPNIGNPTLTLSNPGPNPQTYWYKVGANIIGSPGCVKYDSVLVTVYPIPLATFTSNAPQYCINQTATISYTGLSAPGATYNWNFGGGTVISGSGQGPYTVSWPTSGNKTLSLTVTENNCTSQPYNLQIPVYDYPTSTFTINPVSACQNAPVAITYTGTGTANATYNWGFGGGTVNSGAGQGPYAVQWASAGNPTVSLTVTENGCTSGVTQNNVTIYAIPTANFTLPTQVCVNAAAQELYTGTGSVNATYNWNFDTGVAAPIAGNNNNDVTWATSGVKNVTLTVTENGCTSPLITNSITVYDIPTSVFTLTPGVCAAANAQIDYTGTGTANGTYNWNFNGGTTTPAGGNEDYDISWANAGGYNVMLTVTENGCTSTQTQQAVTVYPIPTSTFTALSPLCDGSPSAVAYTGTGTNAGIYNWNFDSGNGVQGVGENYAVTWPTTGTKNITLVVTENGCSSTQTTQQVIVYPIPLSNFTATAAVCLLDASAIAITDLYSANATYTWNFDGGNAVPSGNQMYNVTWPAPGNYVVSLTLSENGCTSTTTTQNVTVNYQPTATFTSNPYVCVGEDLIATYTGNGLPTATYTWVADGTTNVNGSGQGPFTANWNVDGQYSITLTVTENGCTAVEKNDVVVEPLPITSLLSSYNLCIGEDLTLDPGNFNSYLWSTGLTDRKMEVGLAGNYSVTVIDGNGCVNTSTTTVLDTVCMTLFIPNAFTPNGDYDNELFKPVISHPISYTLTIFNRWGEMLYKSENDPNAAWDGTNKGTPCEADIYIYYVEYKGYAYQKIVTGKRTGTVALIK
jgi:gliding motility-associated-like protein